MYVGRCGEGEREEWKDAGETGEEDSAADVDAVVLGCAVPQRRVFELRHGVRNGKKGVGSREGAAHLWNRRYWGCMQRVNAGG